MDITFLIGNGFDINIGLNTRYKNFYDFYCLQKSSLKDLANLKKEIRNWSDLEVELGKYLGKINDEKKALLIYGDILEKLHSFIEAEENKHPITDSNKNIILEDLLHPEKYVRFLERKEIGNGWLMHSRIGI